MNIVFITDENYALPARAAIRSAIENAAGDDSVTIHVLCVETRKATEQKFQALETERAKINLVSAKELFEKKYKHLPIRHEHVSKVALLKFDLANIFPELDKVLYLDCDVIVLDDIRELCAVDIDGFYAAGAKDYAWVHSQKNHFGYQPFDINQYFNSGVLLINLKKWREEGIAEKLLQQRLSAPQNKFLDQDTLNTVFAGKVRLIDPVYNFLNVYLRKRNEFFAEGEYASLFGNGYKIIHFATGGNKKPWMNSCVPNSHLFIPYLTPDDLVFYLQANIEILHQEIFRSKNELKQELVNQLKENSFGGRLGNALKRLFYKKKKDRTEYRFLGLKIFSRSRDENKRIVRILGFKFTYYKSLPFAYNKSLIIPMSRKRRAYLNTKQADVLLKKFTTNGLYTGRPRPEKVIISLTSIPSRMGDLHYTIYSLLTQSLKPDKVVLYLGEEKFPNRENDLPETLLSLRKNGLSIRFVEEVRSFTKLIPALKEHPNDVIITVDDDIFYFEGCVEKLYRSYQKKQKCIHSHIVKTVVFAPDGQVMPHARWPHPDSASPASLLNFFEGVGGVLYPPHTLHPDVFLSDKFLALCPTTDDIWFWAMAVLQHTKTHFIGDYDNTLVYTNLKRGLGQIEGPALVRINHFGGGNDRSLAAILKAYPEVLQILAEENPGMAIQQLQATP